MYQKYLPALLCTFLFPASLAWAQTEPKVADKKGQNSTTTVIITENNASDYFSKKKQGDAPKTAIKLNPLQVLNGDIPVYVEGVISDKVSVELGAGITIQNFVGDLFNDVLDETSTSTSDVTKQPEVGYSVSGALRYYPSGNTWALEGVYFAPEIRHRLYKSTLTAVGEETLDAPKLLKSNITNFRAIIGNMFYLEDRVFIDYFAGAGVTIRNSDMVHSVSDYNPILGDYMQTTTFYTEKKMRPALALGVKIGFSF